MALHSPLKNSVIILQGAVQFKINSREEIPADLTNHYLERDGAFLLDLEGGVEKARLDEMRANNLELRKEVESNAGSGAVGGGSGGGRAEGSD